MDNMKNKLIHFLLILSLLNVSYANNETTEFSIFGCTWDIPNSMSIERDEKTKNIAIVTKLSEMSEGNIKAITIRENKDELIEFIKSSKVQKTIIGDYNNYFDTYSLSSTKDTTIEKAGMILYEGKNTHAFVMGFTEKQRFELTKKCY